MIDRRETLYRILLVFGSLGVVFLLAESGLRLLYSRDNMRNVSLQEQLERSRDTSLEETGDHEKLGGLVQSSLYQDIIFELKPGLRGRFLQKPVAINSDGMRDREYSREKPPGTFRIVGLGDSVMFGWRLTEEETFLAVLERWLGERFGGEKKYELLNFAVPGYNTAIEVAVFERKALTYDPDLVVIHYVSNDWGVPKFMQRPLGTLSLGRSYFLELLLSRMGLIDLDREERLVGYRMSKVESDAERDEIKSRYGYMLGAKGYKRAMNRLGELARERGIPVIVLIGSTKGNQMEEVLRRARKNGFHALPIKDYTERILKKYGIPNEKRVLRRVIRVAPGDSHPGRFGHYIYAVGLWEKLGELGVIPPVPAPDYEYSLAPYGTP